MNVLAKLFSKPAPAPKEPPRWTVAGVSEVLRYFPVGGRILYSPDSKKELRLDSIVLGCTLNRHFVFSQAQLRAQGSGESAAFVVSGDEGDTELREIQSFYLLVPHQTRSEIDFGPQSQIEAAGRLVERSVNDFERNSVVSLVSFTPSGRVPRIEAAVKSTSFLTKGFYANHKVVVLDPFLNTLSHMDKRRHRRVSTRIPLALRPGPDQAAVPCVMEDFSERFVRVRLGEADPLAGQLTAGRRVTLTLDLAEHGRAFSLQCTVHRKNRGAVVLELNGILKNGRFRELHLVDQLDLKATLLNHPATQEALRAGKSAA